MLFKLKKRAIGVVILAMSVGSSVGSVQAGSTPTGVIRDINGEILANLTTPLAQNQILPTFSGENLNGTGSDIWVNLSINGKSYSTFAPSGGGATWSISLPAGDDLADGAYPFTINVNDSNGDIGPDFQDTLVVDTVAPNAPSILSPDVFTTQTPVFSGTAEPGTTVHLSIAGQNLQTIVDANGNWSVAVPTPTGYGSFTANVYVQDEAGNQSVVMRQTIKVRPLSSLATLSGISIAGWGVTPAFDPNKLSYKLNVKNGTKSVEIRPIGIPAGAYVTVNGVTVPGGRSVSVALRSGVLNKLAIEVTAEDGMTKKLYTVNVNRPAIRAYAKGIGGGKFNPDAAVSRQDLAYMLDQLFSSGSGPRRGSMFMDLCMDHWANQAIANVAKKGIMIGYNGMHFGKQKPITRGQLAVIVSRLTKLPTEPKVVLVDTLGSKNQKVFAGVVEAGYMTADADGTFRPDGIVTRAEAIVLLNKLSNREQLDGSHVQRWSDVGTTHFAYEAIQNATISR